MSNTASEIARLRAALAAETARAQAAERDLAQARALASCSQAMIQELKLEIAKLRRDKYGISSERRARLIDQLELQLEELEATATEDALAAEQAAQDKTSTVRAFTRRKPVRKPFPEHLPRERVVIAAPTTCICCGSDRIAKMGEVEEGHKTVRGTVLPTTHRDAGSHPAPMEGDPAPENQDWAREVHLPVLREDQPAARSIPHHSPWLGRSATDCDGGV